MKLTLKKLKEVINECIIQETLSPMNKRALRFADFWRDRIPVNKNDLGREFDKAVELFVDEDNDRLIPWENPDTGEMGMMRRGKRPSARTTPEAVVAAHVQYNGKVPQGSKWFKMNAMSDSVSMHFGPKKSTTQSYAKSNPDSYVGSQVSGRRQTDNQVAQSAGLSGPLKPAEKERILNDITDVIGIIYDDISSLTAPQKIASIIDMLRMDKSNLLWWSKVPPMQLDSMVKQALKEYLE